MGRHKPNLNERKCLQPWHLPRQPRTVDDIVEAWQEDGDQTNTDKSNSNGRTINARVQHNTSPSEPEKTNHERNATNHQWLQLCFRVYSPLLSYHSLKLVFVHYNDGSANNLTDKHRKVWQFRNTPREMVSSLNTVGTAVKQQYKIAYTNPL
ncbi:hypothetical protein Cantr_01301 [Candida viswanathii]|uniref:Uncharacterized protein n=1 Tax=Candida viswanathii TaxID=5486 RepID=A0A367YHX1_9ASCO|nr:hypothetical protein Cantr_01301 [Candida viswanathii]